VSAAAKAAQSGFARATYHISAGLRFAWVFGGNSEGISEHAVLNAGYILDDER
jgi:hypothetical protein